MPRAESPTADPAPQCGCDRRRRARRQIIRPAAKISAQPPAPLARNSAGLALPAGGIIATTVAIIVVLIELGVIAWVRHRYMDTPIASAAIQIIIGGVLVFLAGVLIGSS